jgi:para-nitrobenzyl esterase
VNSIVECSYGTLRGREERGVHVFRGIPYAAPPLGGLRFRPPQRAARWAGVRDALEFGPPALQNASALGPMLGLDLSASSEDCLYLNVWTPRPGHGQRPVLVWIHGGAFVIGSGSQAMYDGAALARRGDVVVVTVNYRLGALGFLRLDELTDGRISATGCEGLLDQIAALEWVRDEIAAFGGDPGNVTIFGESAGAISVATLLGTPRARGLFHRAALQSGSANFISPPRQATRVAEELLRELGLTSRDVRLLSDIPAARLLDAQQTVALRLQMQLRGLPFAPTVDGTILPQHPFDAIRGGLARDVPVIVGTNRDEIKLFALADPTARGLDDAALLERLERLIPSTDAHDVSRGRRAIETYRAARGSRGESIAAPELWYAIESDRVFRYPAMLLAELQHAHQPRTFAYLFTWVSPFMEGVLGACHALEIPFVFGTLTHPMIARFSGSGAEAERLSGRVQDAWIQFAYSGDPGHAGFGGWPAYEGDERATLVIGQNSHVVSAPLEDERRFWEFWDGVARDA